MIHLSLIHRPDPPELKNLLALPSQLVAIRFGFVHSMEIQSWLRFEGTHRAHPWRIDLTASHQYSQKQRILQDYLRL